MPILMLALIALAVFGIIGFLLAAAVICESRTASRARQPGHGPVGKSAA
jgi:hypothetical protein